MNTTIPLKRSFKRFVRSSNTSLSSKSQLPFKYKLAYSFACDSRQFVTNVAVELLKMGYSATDQFLDSFHEEVINGVHGDTRLRSIYLNQSQLVVVVLSPQYFERPFTQYIERRAILELIQSDQARRICLLSNGIEPSEMYRFDGLFARQDLFKPIENLSPLEVAYFLDSVYQDRYSN